MSETECEPAELWGVFSPDGVVLGAFRLRESAEGLARHCSQLKPTAPPCTYVRYVLPTATEPKAKE